MRFSELTPNRRLTFGPVKPSTQDMIGFAKQFDPQWFHTDPQKAKTGPWEGLIGSGWYTCVMAMRLVCDNVFAGSESYVSPGLNYVRWPNPVRPDDELTLDVLIHEARISSSKPWLGIVRWQWLMRNQDGVEVLDLEAVNLFKLDENNPMDGHVQNIPAEQASSV
jgi:acyl dehydratase